MPDTRIVSSPAEMADLVASTIETRVAASLDERGSAWLALTGGSVATTCLPRLTRARLDWPRVHVCFGDDRAVPPDHDESNYGLAARLLLSHVPVPAAQVYRMRGEWPDLAAAAAEYEEALVRVLGSPPTLDVVLLGVGEDGHVCSLFPGQTPSPATGGWVAAVTDAPKPPPRRLTLTMATLLAARHIIVAVMGAAKAPVVRKALGDATAGLPLAEVVHGGRHVEIVLDRDAAGAWR